MTALDNFRKFRAALGPYAVSLTPAATTLEDLETALAAGWTVRELAQYVLVDWPRDVRSTAALIRARLKVLSATDPVTTRTPTPPRWEETRIGRADGPRGRSMPDDVRAYLESRPWHGAKEDR